jgi:arginase
MNVQLIEVPYDSGHWGTRMGRGPGALLAAGAEDRLRAAGHAVEAERLSCPAPFPTEVATAFRVSRALAERVRAAAWQSRFPLVLAGNCISCVGVLAALGTADMGIVWLDAHADFNSPETTTSGFLDGMALSVAAGRSWRRMAEGITGFRAVAPERILLAGARDVDPPEGAALEEAGVPRVAPADFAAGLPAALDALRERVGKVYVHVDLDVLDPSEGAVNSYGAPGGPALAEVREAIRRVRERFAVRAATLSSYDPAYDRDGRAAAAGLEILEELAGVGGATKPAPSP